MTALWWSWTLSHSVVVVATLYTSLVRGRPRCLLSHWRQCSRLLLIASCLFCLGRALSGVPLRLPLEVHVLAIALAVLMVTRAITETHRHRRAAGMRPC